MKTPCTLLLLFFSLCSCDTLRVYKLVITNKTSDTLVFEIMDYKKEGVVSVSVPPNSHKFLTSKKKLVGKYNNENVASLKKLFRVEKVALSCSGCQESWEVRETLPSEIRSQVMNEDSLPLHKGGVYFLYGVVSVISN